MDWKLFASTFGLIFLAELPDKTAFATLLMASRGNPLAVFIGVAGAFCIQSAVGIAFGSVLGRLPAKAVHVAAGLLFLGFAWAMWREHGEEEAEGAAKAGSGVQPFWKVAGSAFVVIFIAEWGDLTQLATATLAANHHAPLTIFSAATLALWSVTAIGVAFGHAAKKFINPVLLQRVAAVIFAGVGLFFLFRSL